MKVLVTGANGLLGQHLVKQLIEARYPVIATGRGPSRLPFTGYTWYDMDITDGLQVHGVMSREQPNVVVHAAALTQVDECEQDPRRCENINIQGASQVLTDAEMFSSHFIYISTDFVFDGEKGNYTEEDDTNPVSWYGFTKMQAEAMVQTSTIPWAIVRTCLVYGKVFDGTRSNIINWVRDSLQQGKTIKVVADQWRTPTYVEDLVKGILLIIKKKAEGVFHISGKDFLSPYMMAVQTAGYFKLDAGKIEKVDGGTFTQPGRRPLKTGFVIEKARRELGYEPISFEEGLEKMKNEK